MYCGFSLKKGVFVTDDRKVVCDVEGMREYLRRSVRCEADEERGGGRGFWSRTRPEGTRTAGCFCRREDAGCAQSTDNHKQK